MTCIVGLAHEGVAFIGADSAGVDVGHLSLRVRRDEKVFANGDFLFGCTTSFRMIQLLRYKLQPPKRHPETDVMAFMVTEFIESVRNCLKAGGFAARNNEVEAAGTFLVGYAGRIFRVEDDYQVGEAADGFDACGCGQDYALGAMATLPRLEPRARITAALEIAAHFSAGVRGPFHVLAQVHS